MTAAPRPGTSSERLGTADDLAAAAAWATVTVTAYGRRETRHVTEITCLWYGSWHTRTVRLILSRDERTASGYDLALVSPHPSKSAPSSQPGKQPLNNYETSEACNPDIKMADPAVSMPACSTPGACWRPRGLFVVRRSASRGRRRR
jgi:hypothetical protein